VRPGRRRARRSTAQACCGLCGHSCRHCAHSAWVHLVCLRVHQYTPVRTILSESSVLCVLDGRAHAGALCKACCGLCRHLCTLCVGSLMMSVCASNMHLCAHYFLRAVFCASWTEARAQEHCTSLLWSVRTLVQTLCTRCVGSLSMSARASNMHLCTQYFLRALFCASWTDSRALEHCTSLLWSVQTLVQTLCT
jgi:hypothetical protein